MRVTVAEAIKLLKSGQPVALPTETVYGLAAPLSDEKAIAAIFALKGRPSDNPLIIHVASWDEVLRSCREPLPPAAEALAENLWPGPLTLVLPAQTLKVPAAARGGLPTAAFRMPQHPLALEVVREVGPLVMPSANLSGKPSATSLSHVEDDFGENFPVVDGGNTKAGVESTVVAYDGTLWEILRLGALEADVFKRLLGYAPLYHDKEGEKRCPGRRYRHYAPKASLCLGSMPLPGTPVLGFSDRSYPATSAFFSMGHSQDPAAVAASLYHALRSLDNAACSSAWVDMDFPNTGLWITIRERLLRAARKD